MRIKFLNNKFLTTLLFTMSVCSFNLSQAAIEKGGIKFNDTIKFKKQKLVLNGVGIREATILNIDVYVAGLYVKKKSKSPKKIVMSKTPKVLKMKFVRNVDSKDMIKAWDDALLKDKKRSAKFKKAVAKLKKATPEISKGDRFSFTFDNGAASMYVNGKKKFSIKDQKFSRSLLAVWLGKNPPNKGLKDGMLGL